MITNSDTIHWGNFLKGDNSSLEYIYNKYITVLYNYGYKLCQNKELTEDAIQDLFIYIALNRAKLSETSNVKFYLLKSLRNEIFKKLAKSRQEVTNFSFDNFNLQITISHEAHLITDQVTKQRDQHLMHSINMLPARQKEAIFLRFFENLEFEDISEIMNIDTKSVYKIIYKALSNLQKKIVIDIVFMLLAVFTF